MAENRNTRPKTYRVSNEVKDAIDRAAKKHGGVDKALREILIEHPKRCQGERADNGLHVTVPEGYELDQRATQVE